MDGFFQKKDLEKEKGPDLSHLRLNYLKVRRERRKRIKKKSPKSMAQKIGEKQRLFGKTNTKGEFPKEQAVNC